VLSLGSKHKDRMVQRRALAIFAAVQGAQLVARSRGDSAVYDEVVQAYREGGLLP
jgi:TetR/AcrR family transcriptional repressor of nem operon